jgi:hypothetical protein
MACTRSMTNKSKAMLSRPSHSGIAERQPEIAKPQHQSHAAQFHLPPDLHFHGVLVESDAADDNITRLFFQRECLAGIFADLHEKAEDLRIGTNVKLGVCWVLSASSPNTIQRAGALPQALDSLCACLDDAFNEWGRVTEDQRESKNRLQRQLDDIVGSQDFLTLTSEALYEKFADVFLPKHSLTRQEVLDYLPPNFWRPARDEVFRHLDRCYGEEYTDWDLSRDTGWLLTKCLDFPYLEMHFLDEMEMDVGH